MDALKIEKVVDATGAGDAFWSAFYILILGIIIIPIV